MISIPKTSELPDDQRVVITGIGLTAPNGNSLKEFRSGLLDGRSGVREYEIRYFGKTVACGSELDETRHPIRLKDISEPRRRYTGWYFAPESVNQIGHD